MFPSASSLDIYPILLAWPCKMTLRKHRIDKSTHVSHIYYLVRGFCKALCEVNILNSANFGPKFKLSKNTYEL
jgi:hypothetical protein